MNQPFACDNFFSLSLLLSLSCFCSCSFTVAHSKFTCTCCTYNATFYRMKISFDHHFLFIRTFLKTHSIHGLALNKKKNQMSNSMSFLCFHLSATLYSMWFLLKQIIDQYYSNDCQLNEWILTLFLCHLSVIWMNSERRIMVFGHIQLMNKSVKIASSAHKISKVFLITTIVLEALFLYFNSWKIAWSIFIFTPSA